VISTGESKEGVWKEDKRLNWAGEEPHPEAEQANIKIQINNVPL